MWVVHMGHDVLVSNDELEDVPYNYPMLQLEVVEHIVDDKDKGDTDTVAHRMACNMEPLEEFPMLDMHRIENETYLVKRTIINNNESNESIYEIP